MVRWPELFLRKDEFVDGLGVGADLLCLGNDVFQEQAMLMTVVVAAYNSAKTIERCLQAIHNAKVLYSSCELIVVDDGSSDTTADLAAVFTDQLIRLKQNAGRSAARNAGIRQARGEIIVCIDADVIIPPDALAVIAGFFTSHSDVTALTGMLSAEESDPGFFSQYKNLYMNYIFRSLPSRVDFLYGSIMAIRRESVVLFDEDLEYGEDTELGQRLSRQGKKIAFVPNLAVTHLKSYSGRSIARNDFRIPYHWARLFLQVGGWKGIFSRPRGFAHAPRWQLAGVAMVPALIAVSIFSFAIPAGGWLILAGLILWMSVNAGFFNYMLQARGLDFALRSVAVTFWDQGIMAAGIISGFSCQLFSRPRSFNRTAIT